MDALFKWCPPGRPCVIVYYRMVFSWVAVVCALALGTVARATKAESQNLLKAKSFVAALNTLDQIKIEDYLHTGFSPKVGRDSADLAGKLLIIAKQGAPFKLGDVVTDKPAEIVLRLNGKQALELEMKLDFDPQDHLIDKVQIGGPGSQSGPPPKTYMGWKALPDLLRQIKADNQIPAISAAWTKDSTHQLAVIGEREQGKPEQVNIDDRWLIGSITKSMTATMIARLVDQGLLRWDTTIAEALPKIKMRPEFRQVTILQLLQHRGGIPQDQTVDGEFVESTIGDLREEVAIREKYAANVLSREPVAKPGERVLYSNAGYSLAGHIAETVAKQPYEQLMTDLLFKPLGMKTAKFGVPGTIGNPGSEGEIMGHVLTAAGLTPRVLSDARLTAMFAPAGLGVSMSIGDLLDYAEFHLRGLQQHATLMSQENFDALHRVPSASPGEMKYACGWVTVEGVTSEAYIGHNGSDGTFRSELAIWPDKNLAVVSIVNAGGSREPGPALQAVIAIFNRLGK